MNINGMSLFEDELDLARYWERKLKERYQKVYSNVNPASHKFYDHWMEWWGDSPPAQPQIDLLIVDRPTLLAVELKYFRMVKGKGEGKVYYPFYEGIEEALALLRFGFTCVSLWHCFDRELPTDIISRYEPTTSGLISALELPINYAGLYLDKYQDEIYACPIHMGKPVRYEDKERGKIIIPPVNPYGRSNPLKDTTNAKKMLDFLRIVLRIPRE